MNMRRHIPSLDGLRAVSILMVLVGHSYTTIPVHNDTVNVCVRFLGNAHLGVITFFVISGYLITYLLRKELERTNRIDLRAFYLRRTLRILPAFYVYLSVIASLAFAGIIHTSSAKILSAATYSINYNHFWNHHDTSGPWYWFVGHIWTLSLEEQFYLIWPLIFIKAGFNRSKYVSAFIILACPLIRVVTYVLCPEVRGQLSMMLHTASDPLMVGCLVALCEESTGFESFIERMSNDFVLILVTVLGFVISPILTAKFRGAYDISVGITIQAVCIAIILLNVTRRPDSSAGRILNSRLIVSIGVLSYSLYLWQQILLTPLNTTLAGKFPLNILISFVIAMTSYNFIEKPFLRLKNRFAGQ